MTPGERGVRPEAGRRLGRGGVLVCCIVYSQSIASPLLDYMVCPAEKNPTARLKHKPKFVPQEDLRILLA